MVEHETSEKPLGDVRNPSVGSLQLYGDMLTKFSDKCPNAVVATNKLDKNEVQASIVPHILSSINLLRARLKK